MAMVNGPDFERSMLGYRGEVAKDITDFTLYIFKNRITDKQLQMTLFVCQYPNKNKEECNRRFNSTKEFFDHLRIHAGDKPFKCPKDDC